MRAFAERTPGDQRPTVRKLSLPSVRLIEGGEVPVSDTRIGQRYSMQMPNGETVTVTMTPEIMAIATRVSDTMRDGREPDPHDLAMLFVYLSEDT